MRVGGQVEVGEVKHLLVERSASQVDDRRKDGRTYASVLLIAM